MKDMMIKYGNKIACIDSTHGTNMYKFLLITIMVVDEHGKRLPVAWAITNKEDTTVIIEYLTAVKGNTGNIAKKFMSDDADTFYNAWKFVFGETKRLLCFFHVDCAWEKKLNGLIKNKQQLLEVYHQLRTLLTERN